MKKEQASIAFLFGMSQLMVQGALAQSGGGGGGGGGYSGGSSGRSSSNYHHSNGDSCNSSSCAIAIGATVGGVLVVVSLVFIYIYCCHKIKSYCCNPGRHETAVTDHIPSAQALVTQAPLSDIKRWVCNDDEKFPFKLKRAAILSDDFREAIKNNPELLNGLLKGMAFDPNEGEEISFNTSVRFRNSEPSDLLGFDSVADQAYEDRYGEYQIRGYLSLQNGRFFADKHYVKPSLAGGIFPYHIVQAGYVQFDERNGMLHIKLEGRWYSGKSEYSSTVQGTLEYTHAILLTLIERHVQVDNRNRVDAALPPPPLLLPSAAPHNDDDFNGPNQLNVSPGFIVGDNRLFSQSRGDDNRDDRQETSSNTVVVYVESPGSA